MTSWSRYLEVTDTAFSESGDGDPFNDFLGLIDVDFLAACEYTNFCRTSSRVGRRLPPAHSHFLGEGGTYMVRRIPYDPGEHLVASLGEPARGAKPTFVVLKHQIFHSDGPSSLKDTDIHRLRAAMLEMKILRHRPIHNHPNIISLLQTRWDFPDNFNLTLPSVVMDYGDFGTLADFQNPEMLALTAYTKKDICLDIARGLQFLHDCGVVHGDVKPEYVLEVQNVLICKDPNQKGAYLAKISDFGSSLIEVSDGTHDCKPALQRIGKGTPGWRAPNQKDGNLLDASALRRLHIYSYGLLVWSVMLNGTRPWNMLTKGQQGIFLRMSSHEPNEAGTEIYADDFDKFKEADRGEMVCELGRQSLEGSHPGDVDMHTSTQILRCTLQAKPMTHAHNFHGIIATLEDCRRWPKVRDMPNDISPTLLKHGDFYLDSLRLPFQMFRLSTCPLPFRQVMYMEMFRVMDELDDSDPRKSQLRLGLALSHYQRFAPKSNMEYAAELVYQAARAGNTKAQQMCRPCFNHCGLPCPSEVDLWLEEGVQRGSFLARKILEKTNSAVLQSVDDQVTRARERLGDRWMRNVQRRGVNWLNSEEATPQTMDAIFQFFAGRDGITALHKAALTGNDRLVQMVIREGAETDITNSYGETPLHYAAISGSVEATRILVRNTTSISVRSNLKATPLHYAILGSASGELLEYLCEAGADLHISSDSMDSVQQFICSDYCFSPSGTPLLWATIADNADAVYTLLARGASPFRGQSNSPDFPAWQVAFTNRSLGVIEMMFSATLLERFNHPVPEFDEIVPFLGSLGTTPLRLLLHGAPSRKDFVQAIFKLDIWKPDSIEKSLVIFECLDIQLVQEDVVGIVQNIIAEKCFKPNTDYSRCRSRYFGTSNYVTFHASMESFLSLAVSTSSIEMVRMLFRYMGSLKSTFVPPWPNLESAPPCVQPECTFFELLCYSPGRTEHEIADLVECLLAHGADRGARNSRTSLGKEVTCSDPLFVAASDLRVEAVKVFIDNGIGDVWSALAVAVADTNSLLALRVMGAILERRPEILLTKTQASCRPNITTGGIGLLAAPPRSSGLHACLAILCSQAELDRSDAIAEKVWMIEETLQLLPCSDEALLEAIRTRDSSGSTLLHHAATHGNLRLCEFLLNSGADVNAQVTSLPLSQLFINLEALELPETPPVILPSSLWAENPPNPDMPFTFELSKGPTPLDVVIGRSWIRVIRQSALFSRDMMETHRLAGDHKQRRDFQKRTDVVFAFLRNKGAKPSIEL